MALNPISLTASITAAFVAGGAIPGPPLVALAAGLANAIINEFQSNATVLPLPGLLSAAPGSPVTGVGSIK